ncbi:MAG: putative metal-dependent hydrolase [Acidobacteriaceae bacterium]
MQPATFKDPRFPIGKFQYVPAENQREREQRIAVIAALPAKLRASVEAMTERQLETPYREGGWTVRQVVHHVADSHANAYIRVKLALTQEKPTVNAYDEAVWAEMADSRGTLEPSLRMVEGIHARWSAAWRSMSEEQFGREFMHPQMGAMALDKILALYAWHCEHHLAHVGLV